MKNSKIEWCHHTVNFWWGCVFALLRDGRVRQECVHCYAKMMAALFSRGKATWGPEGKRWMRRMKASEELMKLDESARKRGVRERVFVNSMSDTFEDRRDLDEARYLLWITCCCVPNIDVLLLTKRPQNVMRLVPEEWHQHWPANVWIGTTAGTQQAADENVPELLKIPARVRFLSMEPLLEKIDLLSARYRHPDGTMMGALSAWSGAGVQWVICGGESGPGARPMEADWARSLRDQCVAAGKPFFFKQWGEWLGTNPPVRVGKKTAGRQLDGVEWNQVPRT